MQTRRESLDHVRAGSSSFICALPWDGTATIQSVAPPIKAQSGEGAVNVIRKSITISFLITFPEIRTGVGL
jgi:hypothetical protein